MKKIITMIPAIIIILIIVSGIFSTGCSSANKIPGTYEGILPCADCEGINTLLKLNADKSFELEETYLGKDDNPFKSEGSYIIDNLGKITLTYSDNTMDPRYFEVISDKELRMLYREGNKIESGLNYSLIKK